MNPRAHYRRCFTGAAICFALAACSPAQVAKIETGIPADAALVSCIVSTALASGGDVAAVAVACGADAVQVAEILFSAATLPKGATNQMVSTASAVRSTKAFSDAYFHYPYAGK
jgi:hypothetical protein